MLEGHHHQRERTVATSTFPLQTLDTGIVYVGLYTVQYRYSARRFACTRST